MLRAPLMKYDWSLHAKPLDNVWFGLKRERTKEVMDQAGLTYSI